MTKSGGGGGGDKMSFCLLTQEAGDHPLSRGVIITLLFREEDRCSVRAGVAVGERACWRYLHEGCNCDLLCTESREDKPKTLGIFLYPTECTVCHWIQACATQSYYHAIRVIFSAKGIPCKDLHTSTFPRERAECNSLFYFCVQYVNHRPHYKPPVIHILIKHTSTSFALSSA